MEQYIDKIFELIKKNNEVVLIEIVNADGSTPRTVGSFMFVDINKNTYGSIGGGAIEYEAIKESENIFKTKQTKIIKYDFSNNNRLDMVCGGLVDLKYSLLSNDDFSFDILNKLKIKHIDNDKYYIFGAGHVGSELYNILKYLSLNICMYDDRKEYANIDRFDKNTIVVCDSYDNINNILNITNNDFCCVMTNTHENDYIVLKNILQKDPFYVGCLSSQNKINIIKNKLINSGIDKNKLNIINAPIGIQIAAEDPKEIAISIAAEIILYRSKKQLRKKYIENKTIFSNLGVIKNDKL